MKKPGLFSTLLRLLRSILEFYPVLFPATLICILFSAIVSSIPSVFMQNVIALIEDSYKSGDWGAVSGELFRLLAILAALYLLSLISVFLWNRLMAVMTQGLLKNLRCKLFDGMQSLPIRFFDSHNHGEVMSYYTNDIDALRELVSRSIPQIISVVVQVVTIVAIMLYYSVWLTLVVVAGVMVMLVLTKKLGGRSAHYFSKQQQSMGNLEGFVEEMMKGQKVVKVFCHEEASKADFDAFNDQLYTDSKKANTYSNTLMPVLHNMGNVIYAITAMVGGVMLLAGAPNLSISGLAFSVSIVVPFLHMTKQFAGTVGRVSMQINSIVMGVAGARRLFELMDQPPEEDDGEVTLVNVKYTHEGELVECEERTYMWAWRCPNPDGTVSYTRLWGDVRLENVDFGYVPEKTVLHDLTITAEPGKKIALVGSTGAGKTTITNLINRFYDISDGRILYDGIDIKRIRKADLRRSMGIVLQETNLFTGTVMENIRYGNLDSCDEECIAAAQLTGADDFIVRLPDGYDTMLTSNGTNLSQGQRQLLAIARAAVADPPVMIMDEATSSIDTHTEAIVQQGMDALMFGRTVFVIAHRLSTIRNADTIVVLEHGRVIELGNHEQLMALKGKYYQLYTGAFELD